METHKINRSLAGFSSFIQASSFSGIIVLLLGAIVLGSNLGEGNLSGISWGIVFCYLGSGLVGLSILGAFLRQTARVVVEGLGGILAEHANVVNSDGISSGSLLGKLTFKQYDAWIEAGKPPISTWDGEPSSFDDWLSNRSLG